MAEFARECLAAFLGCAEYSGTLDLQLRICEAKKEGFEPDVLLLLEHPPTITLGRNGRWHNLLVTDELLQSKGVRRFEADRGGDITFHGPGQLVGYPLLKLETGERDVHRFMWNLEESLIRLLGEFGIEGDRIEKLTGVWVRGGKIAAMGVHISRWITRHGFALNVSTDLSYYDLIVPCGLAGRNVTSMVSILPRRYEIQEVAERYGYHFSQFFGRRVRWISESELLKTLPGAHPSA